MARGAEAAGRQGPGATPESGPARSAASRPVADVIAFAGSSLREIARILAGRLAADPACPPALSAVTADWLERALSERAPGLRVTAVRPLGGDAGTTSRGRFGVVTRGGPEPTLRVFVKLPPEDLGTRVFVNLMQLGRSEVRFYRELRDALPVRTPRVLAAILREPGSRFALVLEDLAERGARFRDIREPCSLEEARAVVVLLARLHAALWRSPRFDGDLAWLRAPGRHPFARIERAVRERLVAAGVRSRAALLPDDQRAAAGDLSRRWRALESFWSRGPRALLHGDPHLGNLFFEPAGPGLLDWQVVQVGDPLRDLAYFLVLSLSPDVRRRHQRELVRLYSEALTGEGVEGMGFETAWERYRVNALYPWVSALATAGAPRLQAGEIQRAGVERSAAALRDLGSLAALADDAGATEVAACPNIR